jgi:3-mercaptopyruvate sulfurtransferase SseA
VSVLTTGADEWALRGHPWTKQANAPAPAPTRHAAGRRAVLASRGEAPGRVPRVYIASGSALPAEALPAPVIHLPSSRLVDADGGVRPASELWAAISKAAVPRHAQLVFVADDPGDAAINYYVFQLMGYTDLRVLAQ